ncbi:hypothetical protein KUTeg_015619 [Tegillarca granosa]|uniref:Neurexin-4 n=1 Tax=Tegillarca granosa TaxID=220873 RepID=A0ABQ9EQU9_TEGGR|nr:hypothetical protein KUTeg_015619 [Tegillarca granosa]
MALLHTILFILHLSPLFLAQNERDRSPYRDSECLLGSPVGIGVNSGSTIPDGNFEASSEMSSVRSAHRGRLMEPSGAWTAKIQNSDQYLGIDLGRTFMITRFATQGRQGSDEFVTEFTFAFSDDRQTWRYYTNEWGNRMMFNGNSNAQQVEYKSLKYPIIARYVRFHPERWNMVISLRVEVYGCPYEGESVKFNGRGILQYDLSNLQSPPSTKEDTIKLRFKTNEQNGVILYADGNQGDYLSLELVRGALVMHIDLGSTQENRGATEMVGGKLLDDSQWHDVLIRRNKTNVLLVVDRAETHFKTNGLFYRLNVDKTIYLGGLRAFNVEGITVKSNFTGCIGNVFFNSIRMVRDARLGQSGFRMLNSAPDPWNCQFEVPIPITFERIDSYLKLTDQTAGETLRVSFDFRTHNEGGILLSHIMEEAGKIEVKMDENGYVTYLFVSRTGQKIEDIIRNTAIEGMTTGFSDGLWHSFNLIANSEKVSVGVDNNIKVSERSISIKTTQVYFLGGTDGIGIGFRGCMRSISVAATPVVLTETGNKVFEGVTIGSCGLRDRCTPNPCEHNGICTQDWNTFKCNCLHTGYSGEVCHISSYHLSCEMFKMYTNDDGMQPTKIDPDGSGPLEPFDVICNGKEEYGKPVETHVGHDNEQLTLVNGYQLPNFYVKRLNYNGGHDELTEIIERAVSCRQDLEYKCNNSKLLANPGDNTYPHYAWWVGRTFQPMYYWGGSAPGSSKCECGLTEKGCDGGSPTCNCDSGAFNKGDGGQLVHKEYLPVYEVHFGDTGDVTDGRNGQYRVGKLICTGDNLLDNVVTFRKADATIRLATFETEPSCDIWFQFKTTAINGVIMHNTGDRDYVKIELANSNTIRFTYDSGNGAKVLKYRASNTLNNNRWHTVHVEKNRIQAWLKVDEFPAVFIDESDEELTRTLDLTGNLVVGATVEDKNGYVGCLRGLRINGVLQDLRGFIRRKDFTYGLSEGCIGRCDSSPCFHGGTCIEGYSYYTCDCAYTPWRGWMCGREVGVNLQKNYQIKYTFDENQGLSATDFMSMKVGFTTKLKQGILMQLRDENNIEYISLEMNNNGGIKFVVNVGFDRWEINTPNHGIHYTNGQQHIAKMWRTGERGEEVHLQVEIEGWRGERHCLKDLISTCVDNYPEHFETMAASRSDSILDKPKYLFVGNNDTSNSQRGFEGCIFRMQIDNIFPLKRAFQDPKPSFVELIPEGKVREDMCGFEEVTQPPDPIETRPLYGARVNVTYPYEETGLTDEERGIIGAIIAFVYFRQKGDYVTKEAKDMGLADNPDTAIVYNQTGVPDIQKRKECFGMNLGTYVNVDKKQNPLRFRQGPWWLSGLRFRQEREKYLRQTKTNLLNNGSVV